MTFEENFGITISVYKVQYFQVITWNDKDLLKKVVTITYTLEKMFLQLMLLTVCESFVSHRVKKLLVVYLVSMILIWFFR